MGLHCNTCICSCEEPEPVNHCETNAYGCTGDNRKIGNCYSCGLPVCDGPECGALVLYTYNHRFCRFCAECVVNRWQWGELLRFYDDNGPKILETWGVAMPVLFPVGH